MRSERGLLIHNNACVSDAQSFSTLASESSPSGLTAICQHRGSSGRPSGSPGATSVGGGTVEFCVQSSVTTTRLGAAQRSGPWKSSMRIACKAWTSSSCSAV